MIKYYSRYLVIKILKIYQKTLSFDHGILKVFFPHGFCRFRPTCSDYTIEAIKKYGIFKGGAKALWRVLRCNPWNKGGWDPVK
ncbi:MAG: membrane protein insertion efficiency factor YidD [Patescibacteria group bacterium]